VQAVVTNVNDLDGNPGNPPALFLPRVVCHEMASVSRVPPLAGRIQDRLRLVCERLRTVAVTRFEVQKLCPGKPLPPGSGPGSSACCCAGLALLGTFLQSLGPARGSEGMHSACRFARSGPASLGADGRRQAYEARKAAYQLVKGVPQWERSVPTMRSMVQCLEDIVEGACLDGCRGWGAFGCASVGEGVVA
jgi:hypothetical protein